MALQTLDLNFIKDSTLTAALLNSIVENLNILINWANAKGIDIDDLKNLQDILQQLINDNTVVCNLAKQSFSDNISDDDEVTSLYLDTSKTALTFIEGQTFDYTGLIVRKNSSSGDIIATGNYSVNGSTATPGTIPVTVTYGNIFNTYNITVTAKSVTGISFISKPTKTEYLIGESIDLNGLSIKISYNNGTSITTTTATPSGFDSSVKTSSQTVTLTTNGKSLTYTITIKDPTDIQMVDMGLDSGLLWADRDLGATSVGGEGNYYRQSIIESTLSDYEDEEYRLPTLQECYELLNNCYRSVNSPILTLTSMNNGKTLLFYINGNVWIENNNYSSVTIVDSNTDTSIYTRYNKFATNFWVSDTYSGRLLWMGTVSNNDMYPLDSGSTAKLAKWLMTIRCVKGTGITTPTRTDISTPSNYLVDLGIANLVGYKNIGASSESDPGNYYAFGETSTKDTYTLENYTYASTLGTDDRSYTRIIRSTTKPVLKLENDICYLTNNDWNLPTSSMIYNLNTLYMESTTKNGVNGITVYGNYGLNIFIPMTGYKSDKLYNSSTYAYLGTNEVYGTVDESELSSFYVGLYALSDFTSKKVGLLNNLAYIDKYEGVPARPFCSLDLNLASFAWYINQFKTIGISDRNVGANKDCYIKKVMTYTDGQHTQVNMTSYDSENYGPYDYGNSYPWGGTSINSGYNSTTSQLPYGSDIANIALGTNWHTPTETEIETIVSVATITDVCYNGIMGTEISWSNGTNNYVVFLPVGDYWTSTPVNSSIAYYFKVGYGSITTQLTASKSLKKMIRPVIAITTE